MQDGLEVKILLLGGPETGKSSFLKRYVYDFFSEKYSQTIGIHHANKIIASDKKKNINLGFWDISSNELASIYSRVYYHDTKFSIIFTDLSGKSSFDTAILWKKNLDKINNSLPTILVCNKSDIGKEKWVITMEEIKKFYKNHNFSNYYIISVKDNTGIQNIIDIILRRCQ